MPHQEETSTTSNFGLDISSEGKMNQLGVRGQLLARIFSSLVFLLNALGIIDQTAAHEMIERGLPQSLVPFTIISGRALQLTAGLALILGVMPRLAAAALFLFLVPATLISHSFWLSAG